MKFRDSKNSGFYKAKGKGFEFVLSWSRYHKGWYVVASHLKKDIRLNTLWKGLDFEDFEEGIAFCETFNHKDHSRHTLGKDS